MRLTIKAYFNFGLASELVGLDVVGVESDGLVCVLEHLGGQTRAYVLPVPQLFIAQRKVLIDVRLGCVHCLYLRSAFREKSGVGWSRRHTRISEYF